MTGLSDLDAVRPRKPRPVGRKAKPVSRTRSTFAALGRLRGRATLVIASAGFSAIMVGIVCNAVLFQKGHHPSPLFGSAAGEAKPAPLAEARPLARAAVPVAAPVAAAEPVVAEAAPVPPVPAASHRVPARSAAVAPHPAPKPARSADAIKSLLAGKPDGTPVARRPQVALAGKPAVVTTGGPIALHPAARAVAEAATTTRPKVRPAQPAVAAVPVARKGKLVADAPAARPAVND